MSISLDATNPAEGSTTVGTVDTSAIDSSIPASPAEVLDRIDALLPTIRERAAQAEVDRRLADQTVAELKATGLVRMLQPKRYGGLEAGPREFYEGVMKIASACGSAGWVAGVVGIHPWQVALFDDQVQAEVWADDADTWVSSSYMPGGRLTPVDGGFTLSGRWSFSSGSDHCGWVILGVMLDRGEGTRPEMWNVLIPRSDYTIEDTWHTMGLRGTGSNDIVVTDLFVPTHRTINLFDMFSWKSPGLATNDSPLYKLSFGIMFATAITASIVGIAEGVLAESILTTKAKVSTNWGKASEDPHALSTIGRASSELDACRSQLLGNISSMYEKVKRHERLTVGDRSRARRDQVQSCARALSVVDELFDRAGAGVISSNHPMQRLWRDAHAGRHHTANSVDRSLQSYGMTALGFDPIDVLL